MDLFFKFLLQFMSQFFDGLIELFKGIVNGIIKMFNVVEYYNTIKNYSGEFTTGTWILVILAVIIQLALISLIVILVVLLFRKYIRVRKSLVEQEALLDEVAKLNKEVIKMSKEKEKILNMKVSQLGLNPEDASELDIEVDDEGNPIIKEEEKKEEEASPSRFFHLAEIDKQMETYVPVPTNDNVSLIDICEMFRNFSANKLKLYYKPEVIRLFLSSFACTRLIILQGISGTGKTSLPYAWGKFLNNDATIASVQPSWRDRTELFGYFNEFTKKFNETEVLSKMYEASYIDNVYLTILDEMNIARVEYYFAEMLSILEMPSRDEWIIELVPNSWDNDPKKIPNGKLKLPDNMWYIGTINNDDSTFMVTDKVYDRAMPIDINDKGEAFEAPETPNLILSSKHLESLFASAKAKYVVSDENMKKLENMDKYVIEHFRIAFGNRIVKQLREFVPVYVACGGTEIDGIDYIISHKILRKFEQLNLSFIRDEIPDFLKYLDKEFGKENMTECKNYLNRLRKLI